MGFLSSLFQSGTPVPQVAGPPIGVSQLPKELAPYYKDIMGKAQALYNDRTAEGYKPYTGPTMADFAPEQTQAQTGIAGLVGTQAPVFGEAMNLTRSAATPMTQDQMTSYMSPYQQAVTDIEKREATKQYESQVQPQLAAKAAMIQPFGGSRQAILEGMAADTQQRLLGDIQAKGSQEAYQDAVSRFNVDRQAQGQAGAQLATMAPNQYKAQLGEFGALQSIGEEKQKQSQTALDEAFRQYQLERDDPYNTMSKYQSVIQGAPMQQTTFAKPAAATPSIGQQLIGGLGTIGATYGAFGGKLPQIFSKEGGGISDALPIVYRKDKGTVNPYATDPEFGYNEPEEKLVRRPNESVMEFGRRVNEKKLKDKGIVAIETVGVVDDATKIAKENMNEGQGILNINQDSMNVVPPLKKLSEAESNKILKDFDDKKQIEAKINNEVPPEQIAEIEGSKVFKSRGIGDLINQTSGGTYYEGRKKGVGPQILDRSGVEGLKAAAAVQTTEINNFIAANKNRMSTEELNKQIELNFGTDLKTLETFNQSEKDIMSRQMAEDATERSTYFSNRGADNKEAYNRQQYGNLAQFFARLGTATPVAEGIGGLLGAGLQAADETLPQAIQTKAGYDESSASIDYAKRSEEKDAKTITRSEEKSLRKSLFSGKGNLTKEKRADLKEAIKQDINIAKENIAAGNMSFNIAGDVVNAETALNKGQAELTLLDIDLRKPTDFNKIFPNYEDGLAAVQREIGGDVFDGLPVNDALKETAWAQAYKEVIAHIQETDMTISQETLPKGTVLSSMIERAKEIIKEKQGQPRNIEKNTEGTDNEGNLSGSEKLDEVLS